MLPNSFDKVNKKVYTFFQETEGNRSQIETQKNEQSLLETEFDKALPSQMSLKQIEDLSFDWMNFQTFESELNEATGVVTTKQIFQTWEIQIKGLRFEQLSALKHNFLIKFGTGEPLLVSEIAEDTTVWFVKNILSNTLENSTTNIYTFYYGLYIADTDGLEEVDVNSMQVKLQLTLENPNYYS